MKNFDFLDDIRVTFQLKRKWQSYSLYSKHFLLEHAKTGIFKVKNFFPIVSTNLSPKLAAHKFSNSLAIVKTPAVRKLNNRDIGQTPRQNVVHVNQSIRS